MDDLQHQPIEVPEDFQIDHEDRPSRRRNRDSVDKPKKNHVFRSRFVNFGAVIN